MKKSSRKIIFIALAVSLTFNLFFILGYLKTRMTLEKIQTVRGRIDLVSEKLALSQSQKEKITDLTLELRGKQAGLKNSRRETIDLFWAEIVKDRPDFAAIKDRMAATGADGKASRNLEIKYLWKILQVIPPGKREAAVKIIREKTIPE